MAKTIQDATITHQLGSPGGATIMLPPSEKAANESSVKNPGPVAWPTRSGRGDPWDWRREPVTAAKAPPAGPAATGSCTQRGPDPNFPQSDIKSRVTILLIVELFLCSAKGGRFSAPAIFRVAVVRSLGQAWPQATGVAGAKRA